MSSSKSKSVKADPPVSPVEDDSGSSSYPSTAAVVVQDQAMCPSGHTAVARQMLDMSDQLVSEHEDNDVLNHPLEDNRRGLSRRISSESRGQIIESPQHDAESITAMDGSCPAEIPPEADDVEKTNHAQDAEDSDDESDYSYDYEDDDGHYSGFLISAEHAHSTIPNDDISSTSVVPQEDSSHKNFVEDDEAKVSQFATLERTNDVDADADAGSSEKKSKWKKPTQEAVSMSLRAESEKSGGRRRLASDLFKVMMADTKEAGFKVEQKDDECMDKWSVKLFKFDEDSDLHKDLLVLGLDHVELEMNFPEQYPFEPPFVRVVRPRFKRQTGFVMNGALCMELLTNDGWNPINDIESVIVSIRSLLVVGDGRLEAAVSMPAKKREALLAAALSGKQSASASSNSADEDSSSNVASAKRKRAEDDDSGDDRISNNIGVYSTAEAKAAYTHLSNYHKKKGWSGWWAKRG